jgi:hypothetical protein
VALEHHHVIDLLASEEYKLMEPPEISQSYYLTIA